MHYSQYLGSNLSPLNLQNVFIVVNAVTANRLGQLDPSVRVTQINGTHQCTLIVLCNGHISM